MHLRCTEKAYSCSLEFCLGRLYNNKVQIVCTVLFLWPECVYRLSLVCVYRLSLVCVCLVLCHFTRNLQQRWVNEKQGITCACVWGLYLIFFVAPELELGQELEKLALIDKVLVLNILI